MMVSNSQSTLWPHGDGGVVLNQVPRFSLPLHATIYILFELNLQLFFFGFFSANRQRALLVDAIHNPFVAAAWGA